MREKRINRLLQESPKIFPTASPPWLPSLTPRQQNRLVAIIKQALCHCDRIADIAATMGLILRPEHYQCIPGGVYELPQALSDPDDDLLYECNPLTRTSARPKQIEYIQSLPLNDIASIFLMTQIIGFRSLTIYREESPTRFERKTIIEECILRHGTWFLWLCHLGNPDQRDVGRHIISAGRAELVQWETGRLNGPNGLKMTLVARFRELLGGSTPEETGDRMSSALHDLVLGDGRK
jgi:hypothetical protein